MAELGLEERDDAADDGLILILAVPLLPPQEKEEIRSLQSRPWLGFSSHSHTSVTSVNCPEPGV